MNECIECGARVRNSDAVCQNCLDVAAAWIKALKKKPNLKEQPNAVE